MALLKNETQWGNYATLQDVLAKQIAHMETILYLQKEIEKLKATEQSLRETIGE